MLVKRVLAEVVKRVLVVVIKKMGDGGNGEDGEEEGLRGGKWRGGIFERMIEGRRRRSKAETGSKEARRRKAT